MKQTVHSTNIPELLSTKEAARVINRTPQTLRKWACLENGPITPIRINGRLHWKVSEIQNLLNDSSSNGNRIS